MPELPEVETTKIGITPWVVNKEITDVIIREKRLRYKIPGNIKKQLTNNRIISVKRRAKYLLINFSHGSAIIHLGMSGSLRIIKTNEPARKHDHFDIVFIDDTALRYRDPRRFGAFLWSENPLSHRLLIKLGQEPLQEKFTGEYLWKEAKNRRITIKQFIMNANIVVGVGNIYASESLFLAGINPNRKANRISKKCMEGLVQAIKLILNDAIKAGGTTLQDFYMSDGSAGYFKQKLKVYGREKYPCVSCKFPISMKAIGQRSTFYCKKCQS